MAVKVSRARAMGEHILMLPPWLGLTCLTLFRLAAELGAIYERGVTRSPQIFHKARHLGGDGILRWVLNP